MSSGIPELPPTIQVQPAKSGRLEFELMFLCARMSVDLQAETQIRTLVRQEEIDWSFLIPTAHQHCVLPLLYRTLARVTPESVPEFAMRQLRRAFRANAQRNLLLTNELLQVLDIFCVHDIPYISYKGPVLASRVYGDISLRQFGDLDVIVPVKDVARTIGLLASRGYRVLSENHTGKDVTLFRDDLGIELEIHWNVTSDRHPIQISSQLLWEDLDTCSIAGKSIKIHRYEDLLLLHCIHGTTHGWERLGWLCDVAEIVRSSRILDWTRPLEKARALGGTRILLHGLALARNLLGAEPPAIVMQAIETDPMLVSLSEQVKEWLFAGGPLPARERQPYFMRLREHPADKLRVALKQAKSYLALTSRDADSFPVPRFLTWILYPLRPIRLVREHGLAPFTRFFKGIFQS